MGLTHVTVVLKGPGSAAEATYEADFLVNPGATDSLAPADELQKIGITVDPASRTLKRLPAIPLK